MAMLHGGEEDTPMLGFPTLDEIDIKTVHEAYQFLSAQYVDEVMKATSTLMHTLGGLERLHGTWPQTVA